MMHKQKAIIKKLLLSAIPIIVGIFVIQVIWNGSFQEVPTNIYGTQNAEVITSLPENTSLESTKASYYYLNKDMGKALKISAEAYMVGDLGTGEIILSKKPDAKFPIASVTKLMTAVVADKLTKKEAVAKVSSRALATYGGNGGFKLGEKINVSELKYPLLMESSNDAAEILAEHFGREDFIKRLNEEAQGLSMTSTSFADPSGLSPKNQSTVGDLFKLAGYVAQNKPEILKTTTKRSYTSTNKKHVWFSNNQFLSKSGYLGGKSGYIDESRQTGISIFNLPLGKDISRPIAITLLRSKDRAKDVDTIVKYLKKNVYYDGDEDARADWIKENLAFRPEPEPDFVTFAFLGDIMLDRGVRNSVNKNFKGDYSALFEKLATLKDSDIVFANLEGPASDKGKDLGNLYSFRMDPSVVPALKGAGIDILSVANNHEGDWGREAYIDTLSRLKENEILYTGGGTLVEAEQPTIIEKYGMKIGFLGFTDVGPNSLEVKEDKTGLMLANNPHFAQIVKNASSQVDYLIVSFHWGIEYKKVHNARQEELAHKAIDNGAKIIIGHHPHVAQDTEVYKEGFIAYSLGNFIFDQKFSTDTMQGMLLNLTLNRNGAISVQKNTVKLNSVFQPDKIIKGKVEALKFKPISQ